VIVIDACVLADALTDDGQVGDAARAALAGDPHGAAPAHLLIEVVSVIRGKALGGKLSVARADEAIGALPALVFDQIDARDLVDRMWHLRSNISAYDAAYVAAAEALACALVTGDARLGKANGPRCEIKVVPQG
jgi:predicted nucleic acid-binding protein